MDPVGVSNTFNFNRYAYSGNNPVVNFDPNGRQTAKTHSDDTPEERQRELQERQRRKAEEARLGTLGGGVSAAGATMTASSIGSESAATRTAIGVVEFGGASAGSIVAGVFLAIYPTALDEPTLQDPTLIPLFRVMETAEFTRSIATQQFSLNQSESPKYFASTYIAAVYFRDVVVRKYAGANAQLNITLTWVRPSAYSMFNKTYLDAPPDKSYSVIVLPEQLPILNYEARSYGIRPVK